jgi:hypothetical protein
MSVRRDKTTEPPVKAEGDSASDPLYTSEDLFGELVDAPAPPRAAPERTAAARPGPIKVQVNEPSAARKPSPLASPPTGEALPDDVAALLDAFSGPAEAAAAEEPAIDELVDERGLDATGPPVADVPPGAEGRAALAPTPLDADDDLLLE